MSGGCGQRRVRVGLCAMERKTRASRMQHLLRVMSEVEPRLEFVVFSDAVILDRDVEDWPVVDCLIAFYSDGFPVDKALEYVKLRRPFVVNDLRMQKKLLDRREVYRVLRDARVDVLRSVVVDRERGDWVVQENDGEGDWLWVYRGEGGFERICKPFVEKPVSAEDHNVFVYFRGGGVRRLFRKKDKTSSVYHENETRVRSVGSYIYEPYYEPRGRKDVKAYGVGPDWVYAETRKAPTVDGVVERLPNGREVRYKTELNDDEYEMCLKVTRAFRFFVIGFDLLRVGDRTFVIDVNGWSFAKNSSEYASICGRKLARYIMTNVRS